MLLFYFVIVVIGARNRDFNALSDEEYDLLLRKITGRYDTPVIAERSSADIRKDYRWINQGKDISVSPSCKTVYIDGKKLMRKEEIERAIKMAEKESKGSGACKVTGRIKARFIGCSEANAVSSKSSRTNSKV